MPRVTRSRNNRNRLASVQRRFTKLSKRPSRLSENSKFAYGIEHGNSFRRKFKFYRGRCLEARGQPCSPRRRLLTSSLRNIASSPVDYSTQSITCFVRSGIVRETEQRSDQGGELVRERFAEEHDATGPGEPVQPLRQNHHVADTLRQHHR